MKISSLGFGTIVFSLGIFFFNFTSGQNISGNNRNFLTIIFEEISLVISIITVYFMHQNKFDDIKKSFSWLVILNLLGLFTVIYTSLFFQNGSNASSFNNYFILLGYFLFIVLLILTIIVSSQKQSNQNKGPKIIKINN